MKFMNSLKYSDQKIYIINFRIYSFYSVFLSIYFEVIIDKWQSSIYFSDKVVYIFCIMPVYLPTLSFFQQSIHPN